VNLKGRLAESRIQFRSFTDLNARERACAVFDSGVGRELLGPFDRLESPWLEMQNVTPQADYGCILMKGTISEEPAVVIAIEGKFQGGSVGEVSGAKICAALDLACRDNEHGTRTNVVMLVESGGVRLQEANLGLAAIAEIMAAILVLRVYVPVICVTAGPVGCFGGMAVVVGLASYVVMTEEARLGMSGPEVIEEEAGIDELDSKDRALIWTIYGGYQRYQTGMIDALVEDDVEQIHGSVRDLLRRGIPSVHRSSEVALFRKRVAKLDPENQWDPAELRDSWRL
jgi:malonate decarboxylase beta subunit